MAHLVMLEGVWISGTVFSDLALPGIFGST